MQLNARVCVWAGSARAVPRSHQHHLHLYNRTRRKSGATTISMINQNTISSHGTMTLTQVVEGGARTPLSSSRKRVCIFFSFFFTCNESPSLQLQSYPPPFQSTDKQLNATQAKRCCPERRAPDQSQPRARPSRSKRGGT